MREPEFHGRCWLCTKEIGPHPKRPELEVIGLFHRDTPEHLWCVECALEILERVRVAINENGFYHELMTIDLFKDLNTVGLPAGIKELWQEWHGPGDPFPETREGP